MKARLLHYRVGNFKSLGDVSFAPQPVSLVLGPNNSGKSNLAASIHFLSEVYAYGLETAVRRAGGYENIALRKQRRSRSAISFEVKVLIDAKEYQNRIAQDNPFFLFAHQGQQHAEKSCYEIFHAFSFKATAQNIKSEFKIQREYFEVNRVVSDQGKKEQVFAYERQLDRVPHFFVEPKINAALLLRNDKDGKHFLSDLTIPSQQLVSGIPSLRILTPLNDLVGNWIVYQFNSMAARKEGVPTPNPVLDAHGENLPALVDWLITKHNDKWESVLDAMRQIIPGLTDIHTGYLHNKTLGLFFGEEGFGRPWNAEEVSDGTLLTLTMLVAVVDPRRTLLVLEELENSVHPWVLRELFRFIKEQSAEKNIIVTTHAHVIIDDARPENIWAINRKDGVSKLHRLVDLDSDLEASWLDGTTKLSEYIDSGIIESLVP